MNKALERRSSRSGRGDSLSAEEEAWIQKYLDLADKAFTSQPPFVVQTSARIASGTKKHPED